MTPREGLWFPGQARGYLWGLGRTLTEKRHETAATQGVLKGTGHTTSSVTGMGFYWGPLDTPAPTVSSSSSLGFLRASAGGRGGGLLGGCLMVPPTCGRSLGLDSMGVHCSPRVAACRTQSG